MKRLLLIGLLALASGCTRKLPPHVRVPVPHLSSVDLVWWTATQQCDVYVLFWDRDIPKSFQVPVDASLCIAWLKAEGYDVKGVKVAP